MKNQSVVYFSEQDLVNSDGMWYGVHVTVHGTKDLHTALGALCRQYGEATVYGSHKIIDQWGWSFA
jgi:hypothetical protein